jgi:hypothetical protein
MLLFRFIYRLLVAPSTSLLMAMFSMHLGEYSNIYCYWMAIVYLEMLITYPMFFSHVLVASSTSSLMTIFSLHLGETITLALRFRKQQKPIVAFFMFAGHMQNS